MSTIGIFNKNKNLICCYTFNLMIKITCLLDNKMRFYLIQHMDTNLKVRK